MATNASSGFHKNVWTELQAVFYLALWTKNQGELNILDA